MKKFNFTILTAVVCAFSFFSCDSEVTRTESPSFNEGSMQVMFSVANEANWEVLPTDSALTLWLVRDSVHEAATVALQLKESTGLFSIPATVTFDAGDADTCIVLSWENIEPFVCYRMELAIEDAYTNPYLDNAKGTPFFSMSVTSTDWAPFTTGKFGSAFITTLYQQPELVVFEQTVYYSEILGYYRMDPYVEGYWITFGIDEEDHIYFPTSPDASGYYPYLFGMNYGDFGMMSVVFDADPSYSYYLPEKGLLNFNGKVTVKAGTVVNWSDEIFVSPDFVKESPAE